MINLLTESHTFTKIRRYDQISVRIGYKTDTAWRPTYVYDLSPWLFFVTETAFSMRYEPRQNKKNEHRSCLIVNFEYRTLNHIDCKSPHSKHLDDDRLLLGHKYFIACIKIFSVLLKIMQEF